MRQSHQVPLWGDLLRLETQRGHLVGYDLSIYPDANRHLPVRECTFPNRVKVEAPLPSIDPPAGKSVLDCVGVQRLFLVLPYPFESLEDFVRGQAHELLYAAVSD